MAINFPDNPTNGQTVNVGGNLFTYSAASTRWTQSAPVVFGTVTGNLIPDADSAYDLGSAAKRFQDLYVKSISAGGHLIPDADSAYDLGSTAKKWKSLHLSANTLFLGDSGSISAGPGGSIQLPAIKIGTGTAAVELTASSDGKLATKGTDASGNTEAAASEAGAASSVTNMAQLVALTGMTTGQTALVTSLNRIFMYTGTGWFKIADMTNESPTAITGVDATYPLATDGTATVVTAISTDPEGFPLTWSYAVTTGSLGSTATVTQAANVFTITPSSDAANVGTFSITFSVTDGATGAVNAVSAFTLAFEMSGTLAYTLPSPTPTVGGYWGLGVAVNDTYTAFSLPGPWSTSAGSVKVYNNSDGTLARTISNYDGSSTGNMSYGGSLCCSSTYVCAMSYPSASPRIQIFNMSTGAHVRSIQLSGSDGWGGGDGWGNRMAMNDTYLLLGAPNNDTNGTNTGKAVLYRISDGVLMWTAYYAPSGAQSSFGQSVAINETQAAVVYNRGYMGNPWGGTNGVRILTLSTGAVEHTINAPVSNSSTTYGHGLGLAMNDNGYVAVGQPDYPANAHCYVYNTATGALRYTLSGSTGSTGGTATGTAIYGRLQLKGTGNLLCCGPVSNWTSGGSVEVYDVTDGTHKFTLNEPNPISGFTGTQKSSATAGKFGHFMDISESGTVLSVSAFEQYGSGNTTNNVGYSFIYK